VVRVVRVARVVPDGWDSEVLRVENFGVFVHFGPCGERGLSFASWAYCACRESWLNMC